MARTEFMKQRKTPVNEFTLRVMDHYGIQNGDFLFDEAKKLRKNAIIDLEAEIKTLRNQVVILTEQNERLRKDLENQDGVPARVSIHGMYDMHLFIRFTGPTVDAIISEWISHNLSPNPAIVGGREVDDLGPAMLCPAIVLDSKGKELRRVGEMVFWREGAPDYEQVEKTRSAWLEDPDIPRLLKETHGKESENG